MKEKRKTGDRRLEEQRRRERREVERRRRLRRLGQRRRDYCPTCRKVLTANAYCSSCKVRVIKIRSGHGYRAG